jgi:hypothetical protein
MIDLFLIRRAGGTCVTLTAATRSLYAVLSRSFRSWNSACSEEEAALDASRVSREDAIGQGINKHTK